MRQAPRSSTVQFRAIVAAVLALAGILAVAAVAWAAPSLSIDSGPSGPTSDPMPLFGFTADAGATVECSIDQGTPAFGPCSGAATHAPDAPLPDGDYVFRVQATDAAQEQTVESRAFTVDTVAPAVGVVSGPSGPTNDTMPSFGFAAEAGATVECSVDQGIPAYGPCTTASSHSVGAPLADGSYVFRVRATDGAGNQASASQAFSVDTAAPSLSIDSGPSGPTNDATPSFGFTAEGGATVQCSVDQGIPAYGPCTTASSHTVAPALADGSYVFRVRATDAAGNEAVQTRSFSVDTVAPTVGVVSGPNGPTNDTMPSFGFTAEAGATVQCSVDHGTPAYGPCTTASSHTVAPALADGSYVFRVRATDGAGNQASASQAFSVDTAAPSLSIDSGPSGPTNDATPSFGFTAEAGATVQCSVDQGNPAYGPCTSATTHVVGTPLSQGTHVFRVRATKVDNDAIVSRTFTVDTTPPSLSIGFGPSGTTSDSTPLFGFSAEAGATVACSIDQGAPAYGPCASATTHAADAPLADGAYVFRVRATDAAGNQASTTRAFTVDTLPQAPAPVTPRPNPTPPVTTPVTPTPSKPRLLSPFPLVRISGTLTSSGARITLLSVRAPRGALVRVTVSPSCSRKRHAPRRCRVLHAAGTVGRRDAIDFRGLARAYRSGTVIVVRVWRADLIGKYTRFTIVRGRAPRRVDQCLVPSSTHGSRCPAV
jgi:Bacterial Ig-like domain